MWASERAQIIVTEAAVRPPEDILARYQAAEAVLDTNVASLVLNEAVVPNWVGDRVFWYRRQRSDGGEYVWVENDAARPAFDHQATAKAISAATGKAIGAWDLVVEALTADVEITLRDDGRRWRIAGGVASDLGPVQTLPSGVLVCPQGDRGLIAREHDLYLRALATGEERRMTDNGEADFAWGQYPDAGLLAVVRRRNGLPFAPFGWSWSPDGEFLIGGRVDERHIEPYPFLESLPQDGGVRPRTYHIRQPLVGETGPIFEAMAIHVGTGRKIPVDLPAGLDHELSELEPVGWSDDNRRLFVAAILNGVRETVLLEIDIAKGQGRIRIAERPGGFLKLGSELYKRHNVRILAGGAQAIWYSERSGFGHLYRYDLATSELINQITSGDWQVRDILKVDERQGRVYFTASGPARC